MRAVFDTNVLVSALVFPGGAPESVFRWALEGRLELVTSTALLVELTRILNERFGWDPAATGEVVALIVRISHVVEVTEALQVIRADPSDDRVLEAAASGHANVIVSGDRHLLQLRVWRQIPIMRPTAFVEKLDEER